MAHHTGKSFIRDLGPMKLIAVFQRILGLLKAPSFFVSQQQQNDHEISIPLTKAGTEVMFPTVRFMYSLGVMTIEKH